jgi:hypothetical protein
VPDAFTFIDSVDPSSDAAPPRRRVLITGAGGNIGRRLAPELAKHHDLTLGVYPADDDVTDSLIAELKAHGTVRPLDITKLPDIHQACEGIDTVIHLAGEPNPNATWDVLRDVNIEGTYQTLVAAEAAGCRRVVLASSIHAVSAYPPDRQVHENDPPNPGDLYGVTKASIEAMGRYFSTQRGLSVIAVRIAGHHPLDHVEHDGIHTLLDGFVSARDLNQLFLRTVNDTRLAFAIVHGLSDNLYKRLAIDDTRALLNYHPQDDLTELNPQLRRADLPDRKGHDETGDGYQPGIRAELEQLRR